MLRNNKRALFILLLLFLLTVHPVYAQNTSSVPSLSDEVYADLALRGYLSNVSIVFYNGNQKDVVAINGTKHWLPASTVKLFAAMYAFKQITSHKLNLYDYVIADPKNIVPTELVTDQLPAIQGEDTLTVDRLLRQMITQSDNTSFNIMLDILDRKAISEYIHSLGLTHSAVGSKLNLDTSQQQYEFDVSGYGINTTTAEDYTKAFTLILQNKIPGAKPLLDILKQQKINYMLPRLLPKDIIVAHKHGDLDPLYHDGGIVFANKSPYVVSIFSNVGDPNLVAHLSELIYSRDPKLVGASIQNSTPLSFENQSIDPIVAQGSISQSNVLAAQSQPLQTQPITAADLGITAKDLSLVQSTTQLPRVIIPADSPWNFLVPLRQSIKKAFVLTTKAKTQIDLETMLLQVSEAKDLAKRGKSQEANVLLRSIQQSMNTLANDPAIKNNAPAQIMLQAISETRFQILADALKTTSGTKRNELIWEIGQQAKNTLLQVQPNLPLATNATNVTQKPLIGQVIDKNDTSMVVRTAGGQALTVSLTDQTLTVKTKEIIQPVISPTPIITENTSSTPIPTPTTKPSLSSVTIGTTVALVGSSVGNTFTPTFILTNVPKELAAPEPVVVLKVNQKNHTMIISENDIPVQVNVSSRTVIRGSDTSISFNQIKSGDVVVVHGQPLTPIVQKNIQPEVSVTPGSKTTVTPQLQKLQKETKTNDSNGITISPIQNQKDQTVPVSTSVQNTQTVPTAPLQQSPPSHTTAPSVQKQATQPQPKVIQSTSIQVIQKKEDASKTQKSESAQPKPEQKSQQSSHEEPKSQPQKAQPAVPTSDKSGGKK